MIALLIAAENHCSEAHHTILDCLSQRQVFTVTTIRVIFSLHVTILDSLECLLGSFEARESSKEHMPALCDFIGSPAPLWSDDFHSKLLFELPVLSPRAKTPLSPPMTSQTLSPPILQMIIFAPGKDYRLCASVLGEVHAVQFGDPYLWQWLGIGREEGVFPAHICQAL